jgi:hypothetical protein
MRKYKPILNKEIYMNSIADGSVIIQTSSESVPSHELRNELVKSSEQA